MATLDPHAPLVIDTHELGRRAGSMVRVQRTVPAPADLGSALITVPPGSDLELDLRLESVVEGVYVTGTVRRTAVGECSRCLDPLVDEDEVTVQELYVHPGDRPADDDLPELVGDLIDFEPTLRDAVVLALPLAPVCRDDCPGLCSECGTRLADDPGHGHDIIDPRWAALAQLEQDQPTEGMTKEEG